MLAKVRRGSKHAAVKGEQASKTTLCVRFAAALRFYTALCGGAMGAMGILIIVLSAINVGSATEACGDGAFFTDGDDEGSCRLAVDQAVSFMAMSIFLLLLCGLTLAAEKRARCVARYLGFLCTGVGKGIYLLGCGTSLASLGRYFKDTGSGVGAEVAALAPFIVGMMHIGAGAVHLVCGCCLPADDPLRREFSDYATGLKMLRQSQPATSTSTADVTVVVDSPAAAEPNGKDDAGGEEDNPFKKKPPAADGEDGASDANGAPQGAANGTPQGAANIYSEPVGDENPFRQKAAA